MKINLFLGVATFLALTNWLSCTCQTLAQSAISVIEPDPSPLDLALLQDPKSTTTGFKNFDDLLPGAILSSETICQESLTLPSLWWTKALFEAKSPTYNKLVTRWLTYLPNDPNSGRVDLVVDSQRWSLMDYFNRYEFINIFGSTGSRFGYNTRIFDVRGDLMGAYTCSFPSFTSAIPRGNPSCSIELESAGLRTHDNF
jgi:hypothetical protein